MSYLALAKKIQGETKPSTGGMTDFPAVDAVIDETVVAVLINSMVLGAPIWFALRDGWAPDQADGMPIFYASELPELRQKTPDQLRSIFHVKRAFGGGMVRQ